MPGEIRKEIEPNSIVCCDVLDGLSRIRNESVHLVVCSPPFNVGISYDNHDDNMNHWDYLKWMKQVWWECKRLLVSGGRICINIDATMNMQPGLDSPGPAERVHPLHANFYCQLRDMDYIYRGEVIWTKQNAPGKDTAWGSYCLCSNPHIRRNSEYIVLASKDSLDLEGDNMMCDLTKEEFHEWTLSEWKIKPETSKKGHPVPFPRELVKRCVKLFSYVGNTILDPFNGSGTTTSTAYELGRSYIGIDNSEKYCKRAKADLRRIEQEFKISGPYSFTPAPVYCEEQKSQKKKRSHDLYD